jgi:proteasome accessory factor A
MQTVMGGETEYAISARGAHGRTVPQHELLGRFFGHATSTLGYASTSTRGRFLRNGGLLYLDAGLHMEWATPETTSPFEVVRYLAAGDQILREVAASLQAVSDDIAEVFCSRTNVDYVSGTLWAAHESYMHRADVWAVQTELVPFLASRVLFGAGGWDHQAPGLRFTMSPRAHFINVLADRDSQYVRPLFHTKDEPHSRVGTHRLHVACGEVCVPRRRTCCASVRPRWCWRSSSVGSGRAPR